MPISSDGTFDDGTSFTNTGTGTPTGAPGTSTGQGSVDPMAPHYEPGSGYWVPGEGWVSEDEYDRAQAAYQQKVANGTQPSQMQYDPSTTGNEGTALANPYSDVTYYGNQGRLANMPQSGPTIDQTASGESRDLSMDAIGLMRNTALGNATPAQVLQAANTAGAVNAVDSGAASIKGGAQAQAAASMAAAPVAQRTAATGAQDQAALAAKEQADATNQYFGASSAQRGRDLGLATSQAQLDAAQRAANEQKNENYASMQFNQQKAITAQQLGQTAEQQNASNASRNSSLAEQQASMGRTNDVVSGVSGGLQGAIKAYGNTQDPNAQQNSDNASNPWSPQNYSGSDPLMKTNVKPVSDAEAARLRKLADDMSTQQRASLAAPTAVGRVRARAQEEAYDGKYLQPDAPPPAHKPTLSEAMDAQVARDREDIVAEHPTYGLFSPDDAPQHPAGGWALGEGFSDDPARNYTSRGSVRPENTWAPGSADFYAGSHAKDLTTSDPTAKRAAFVAGMSHANEAQDSGHFGTLPDYMQQGAPKQQPADTTVRKTDATVATRPDAHAQHVQNIYSQGRYDDDNALRAAGAVFGPGMYLGAGVADREETARHAAAVPPMSVQPTQSLPERARQYASDQLSRLYPERNVDLSKEPGDTTTSDPRAKDEHRFGTGGGDDPMANANRSMEASSYEYKPEFLPADQKPGEVNVGPMADKMKADPVAGTAIVTDPKSGLLAIDKTKALKVVMGSLSSLQRQQDRSRDELAQLQRARR